jgi:hypothetical protein
MSPNFIGYQFGYIGLKSLLIKANILLIITIDFLFFNTNTLIVLSQKCCKLLYCLGTTLVEPINKSSSYVYLLADHYTKYVLVYTPIT